MTEEEPIPFPLVDSQAPEPDGIPSFEQCLTHSQNWEEGCDYCLGEFNEGSAYLDGLLQSNTSSRKRLTQKNGGVDPLNDLAVIGMRLDMLMGMVLNNKGRMIYEVNFHRSLVDILQSVEKEMTTQRLLGGVNGQVPKMSRQERRRK